MLSLSKISSDIKGDITVQFIFDKNVLFCFLLRHIFLRLANLFLYK